MTLPPPQDELVRAVAAVNPRTVVVVNAASPVDDAVGRRRRRDPAVLVPGRGVGQRARRRAVAATSRRRASCRRPSRCGIEDTPAFTQLSRASAARCATAKACSSATAGTTRAQIEPRFCFGHGLSYTTFDLGDVAAVHATGTTDVRLDVPVTQHRRTTRAPRSCSATCTTSRRSVARPPQELKAFAKVWLDPGESRDGRAGARRARRSRSGTSSRARLDGRARRVRAAHRHVVARHPPARHRSRSTDRIDDRARRSPSDSPNFGSIVPAGGVAPLRRSRARRRRRGRRPHRRRRPRRDGSAHRELRVGQVPGAARRAVVRAADVLAAIAAVTDAGPARDRHPDRAAAARPCCSRSRRRRSTCCRGAGSTSASAPAGSARSTTPKGSTSTRRGQLLDRHARRVQGAVARHAGRARHADAVVPRHLLRARSRCSRAACRCGSAARCTSATSTGSCATATRGSRSWASPLDGIADGARADRGRVASRRAAIPTVLQVQAPLRIERGDDGRPDLARSMASVPELVGRRRDRRARDAARVLPRSGRRADGARRDRAPLRDSGRVAATYGLGRAHAVRRLSDPPDAAADRAPRERRPEPLRPVLVQRLHRGLLLRGRHGRVPEPRHHRRRVLGRARRRAALGVRVGPHPGGPRARRGSGR